MWWPKANVNQHGLQMIWGKSDYQNILSQLLAILIDARTEQNPALTSSILPLLLLNQRCQEGLISRTKVPHNSMPRSTMVVSCSLWKSHDWGHFDGLACRQVLEFLAFLRARLWKENGNVPPKVFLVRWKKSDCDCVLVWLLLMFQVLANLRRNCFTLQVFACCMLALQHRPLLRIVHAKVSGPPPIWKNSWWLPMKPSRVILWADASTAVSWYMEVTGCKRKSELFLQWLIHTDLSTQGRKTLELRKEGHPDVYCRRPF